MNTTIKHKFIPRVLAALLFFSASIPSFGQEFIRGAIDYLICDTSIVRGTAIDTVLIYNRLNRNRGRGSTFSMVTLGNPIAMGINIEKDSIFINDFEYHYIKRTVYFCGFKRIMGVKKAIIGYFRFDPSFNNNNFYYYDIFGCKELKKLDFYTIEDGQYSEEIHLVATGTSSGLRSDFLVDMTTTSTPGIMNCHIHFSYDENEDFDDVATTNSKIVVSSRSKVHGIPVVNFWYFKKPHNIWQNIFGSNVNRFRISSPIAESPVILEHTRLDSIAAVYKIAGFSQIAMLRLEAISSNYKIFEIVEDTIEEIYPIDIKYNTNNSVYAILARAKNMQNLPPFVPYMQIYRVIPSDLGGLTSSGQGRKYTNIFYKIWSLDFWWGANTQFAESGGEGQIPKLFRFDTTTEYTCSDKLVYPHYNGELKGDFMDTTISPISFDIQKHKIEPEKYLMPFPVECGKE